MIEQLATVLGRHVRVRGTDRLLRLVYPCRHDSRRFVAGIRQRGDGMRMRVDTRTLIDWYSLFHGEYEPTVRRTFETLLTPGSVAIDVGANVGAHTLTLGHLVGPAGRVLAFEPNPAIQRRLEENIHLNRLDTVTVFGCALGATDTLLSLRIPTASSEESSNPGMASLVALDTPHELVEVEVRRLDGIVAAADLQRLDLVKIDVQGYEYPVLQGMADAIRRFAPAIILEYEDWAWERAGHTFGDAMDLFHGAGYSCWHLDSGERLGTARPASRHDLPPHMDVIALPEGDPRRRAMEHLD